MSRKAASAGVVVVVWSAPAWFAESAAPAAVGAPGRGGSWSLALVSPCSQSSAYQSKMMSCGGWRRGRLGEVGAEAEPRGPVGPAAGEGVEVASLCSSMW